jgi:phosphohistidine phosphatase
MPKQLMLVRHGKATHGFSEKSDFDRRLTDSGRRDAREMALKIKGKDFFPELLISSPAARALETAIQFADVWASPADSIRRDISIYEADTKSLLDVVLNIDDNLDKVTLFGHNPGITDLASYLTGANSPAMPTAAVVWIEFPFEEWKFISQETGTILLFDYPRT